MKRPSLVFIPVLMTLLIYSCDPHRVYEKNIAIPGGIWAHEDVVKFEVMVEDTTNTHNLYVNVRHTHMYPLSNLYLFITTTAPSGDAVKDTLEIILADSRGKWHGSGLGNIYDLQQVYKENVRFAQKGLYRFVYQQAMRMEQLPYIIDVGLRVEKTGF